MREKIKVHFSSKSNEWATPLSLFNRINSIWGPFDLDPCCTVATAKCRLYYTKEDDGLSMPWGVKRVFVNPPYGREIGKWVKKAYNEYAKRGTEVVLLIPARTDNKWWHQYCMVAKYIVFIKGRVKFEQMDAPEGTPPMSAPFPSCLVIFQDNGKVSPMISAMDVC